MCVCTYSCMCARTLAASVSFPLLPRTPNPEDGVTVYFHAIVSRDFAFNPDNHRVYVRGGQELGKKGWSDACEMCYTK